MLQLNLAIHLPSLGLPWKKGLQAAAQLGATAVEIDGRSQFTPREMSRTAVRHVRKIMEDVNIRIAAVYFRTRSGYDTLENLDRRVQATKDVMTMAYELGAKIVVNHVGRVTDAESPGWSLLNEALSDIGRHGQKVGVTLAACTGSEDAQDLKRLIDALPTFSIGVAFDPGALIVNGYSASEAIAALGEYVVQFRAHDAVRDAVAGRGIDTQLGRGSADVAEILANLEQHEFNGFTVVKATTANADLEISQAMQYLKSYL